MSWDLIPVKSGRHGRYVQKGVYSMSSKDDLFLKIMGNMGVKPLTSGSREETACEWIEKKPQSAEAADRELFIEALERMEPFQDKDRPAPGPARGLRKLKKRPKATVLDDTLDLHGKTRQEALALLAPFVSGAFVRGFKFVAVITGKGLHSRGGVGVLKRAVEQWILQRGKRFIQAYQEADRAYGGKGAFILHLRKD